MKSQVKPTAKVIGQNGNTLNVLAICNKALRRSGQDEKTKELTEKVFSAGSYEEALHIMQEYVEFE